MSKKEKKKKKDSGVTDDDAAALREKIEGLQKEKDELLGKLQRVSADYANFQKRVPKQISDSVGYQKERVIRSLLPVLDNFEHTLASTHTAEDIEVLVTGIRIVYDQMLDILKSHEVEQIHALGETFDPAQHQAMMQRSDADQEANVVLEEFQKGYTLNGRVIRPSKVIVNMAKPEEEAAKEVQAAEAEEQCDRGDGDETTDTE